MPLMRAAIGLLALFFAHYLGRSAAGLVQRREARSRTITWTLRTAVCVLAVFWGYGPDTLALIVFVLVVLSLVSGMWVQFHPPKDERLVEKMFPKE
mgnify:CR=1 FL=1